MPDRWEQYGIDPAEITASVDAVLIGNAVARGCVEDASAALLRTPARTSHAPHEEQHQSTASSDRCSRRCHLSERRQYETRFRGSSDHGASHAAPRASS